MTNFELEKIKGNILPISRCISCKSTQLELAAGKKSFNLPFSISEYYIHCLKCEECYPITDDCIPIFWTPMIRQFFQGNIEEDTNVYANIRVYDAISDEYLLYRRQKSIIADRLQSAVDKLLDAQSKSEERPSGSRYHLDFGCGPGKVLVSLKKYDYIHVGMDLSLVNLRNTRQNTGALVVCGDASNMPFRDGLFDLVTESAVLHHIEDWKAVISECCRVSSSRGGVILDSEPSSDKLDWSRLAKFVFNLRFPVYKILSYVWKEKHVFRNTQLAKLNLLAEIHMQPGKGFPLEVLRELFSRKKFDVEIVLSPNAQLQPEAKLHFRKIVIDLLNARNPWNPKYGNFIAIAKPVGKR